MPVVVLETECTSSSILVKGWDVGLRMGLRRRRVHVVCFSDLFGFAAQVMRVDGVG